MIRHVDTSHLSEAVFDIGPEVFPHLGAFLWASALRFSVLGGLMLKRLIYDGCKFGRKRAAVSLRSRPKPFQQRHGQSQCHGAHRFISPLCYAHVQISLVALRDHLNSHNATCQYQYKDYSRTMRRKQKTTTETVQMYVRLPPGLHAEITDLAAAEGRSLNSLVVELLERSIQPLRVLSQASKSDPLAVSYMAADAIATYADVVRMGLLQCKMDSGELKLTDDNVHAVAGAAPGVLRPAGVAPEPELTAGEAALLAAWRQLPDEQKSAAATLLGAKTAKSKPLIE
jgi:hypothetical protein